MNTGMPDDLGPYDSGLESLFRVLTGPATPDEAGGEADAVAMFRASRAGTRNGTGTDGGGGSGTRAAAGTAAPGDPAAARQPAPRRRHWARPGRLLGAAAVALIAAFVTCAYAAVLPSPVQHAAYRMLGFAGVPDAPRPAHSPPGQSAPAARPGGPAPAQPGAPGPAASRGPAGATPSPAATPGSSRAAGPPPGQLPLRLSAAAAARWVMAGSGDSITGLLTGSTGHGIGGQPLTLLERTAGQPAWRPAGHTTTGSSGTATIPVPDLTASAAFLLTGPDGARSRPVGVVVVLPVALTVAGGPGPRTDTLTVSSPVAAPGSPAVVQVRAGGRWVNLGAQPLSGSSTATFTIRAPRFRRRYRAVLPPTGSHGLSVSAPVTAGGP